MSIETVASRLGASDDVALAIERAVIQYGIQHPAEFIGQMVVESQNFSRVVENLNYSAERLAAVWPHRYAKDPKAKVKAPNEKAERLAHNPQALANDVYAGRMGNTAPNDGWLYRGQGYKQLTGKDNFRAYSYATYGDDRALLHPAMLQALPDAVNSGAWYWKANNIDRYGTDVLKISRAVNLGTVATQAMPIGYNERVAATEKARAEFQRLKG